jgi:Cof subfamily protein (haloacid dehalogenase superfamily)
MTTGSTNEANRPAPAPGAISGAPRAAGAPGQAVPPKPPVTGKTAVPGQPPPPAKAPPPPAATFPTIAFEDRRIILVAVDLDGTLLRSDKGLTRNTVNTVRAASQLGVKVVLATARPPRSAKKVYDLLGLDTLQINYNGAMIYDPVKGKTIYHMPIPGSLAKRIIAVARKIDAKCVVSIEILDKWYTDQFDPNDDTVNTAESGRTFAPDFVGPVDAFLQAPVTKLMLISPPFQINKVKKEIEEAFKGEIALPASDPHLIQIVHAKVDKAHALKSVCDSYGISSEKVMAIGDAPNDVGMLKWSGLGVAVGNAFDEARRAADVIVPANDEDGVAHALKRYVLENKAPERVG